MRVVVPTPLRSYTSGASHVEAQGEDLQAVVDSLDRSFPGFKFRVVDEQGRIRTHIKFFVGAEMATDLSERVRPGSDVTIICALSGG